jgi:hypothetical protein
MEFMENETDLSTFETLTLESTSEDKNGMRYKLKELYDQDLPEYYETGILIL